MRGDPVHESVCRMSSSDADRHAPVLAAFNPETAAGEPVEFGIAASRVLDAPLVIVAVRHGGPLVNWVQGHVDEGDKDAIDHVRLDLERRGVAAEIRESVDQTAGGGVVGAMEELRPQLVVVGTTHRGRTGAALLGTTAERVIHASNCPVAVVPHGYSRPEAGVRRIGGAYAPTVEGRAALHQAAALAHAAGGEVRAIRVLDPDHADAASHGMMAAQHHEVAPEEDESARHRVSAEREFETAVATLAHDVPVEFDVLFTDPADGLVAAAQGLDMLVMGSRARGPRRAVLLGSVSRQVAQRSPCPVLIVPRASAETAETLLEHAGADGS
jgi:nucleotide-binding universal stress UspA family protein